MVISSAGRIDENKLTKEELVMHKLGIWEEGGNAYFGKLDEGFVIRYLFNELIKLKKDFEDLRKEVKK